MVNSAKQAVLIKRLTKEVQRKLRLANQLEKENAPLVFAHGLLVAICDLLDWIRMDPQRAADGAGPSEQSVAMFGACAQEMSLLEQLAQLEYSGHNGSSSNSGSWSRNDQQPQLLGQKQQCPTIAPPGDPLWLPRHMLSLPPCPAAAAVSLAQLQDEYAATLREVSMALHAHEAGILPPGNTSTTNHQPTPLERIQAQLYRHMHLMMTLLMSQRVHLIFTFSTTHPGAMDGSLLHHVDSDLYDKVVARLGLSEQQQQQIVAGADVFAKLCQPVHEELRQLQTEVANSNSTSGFTDMYKQSQSAMQSLLRSEEQLQKVDRINLLLKKEYFLKMLMKGHQYGCLTWVQLAQALVLLDPLPCLVMHFAAAVTRLQLEQRQSSSDDTSQGDDDSQHQETAVQRWSRPL